MATFYLDSNASGSNNGSSFADAFTSINSLSLSAGDLVLVASDHSQSSASIDITFSIDDIDLAQFVSVNSTTEAYEPGAALTATVSDILVQGVELRGFTLTAGDDLLCSDAFRAVRFIDCTISCDAVDPGGYFEFIDCAITCTNAATCINEITSSGRVRGGSITNANIGAGDAIIDLGASGSGFIEVIGVDMSGCPAEFLVDERVVRRKGWYVKFVGCSLNAATSLDIASSIGDNHAILAEVINCVAGTITAPALAYKYEDPVGDCELDTTVSRTDGASDGDTAYSMSLTAFGNQSRKSIRSAVSGHLGITQWVEPADTNLRVYIAHDAVGSGTSGALQGDECWVEYQGPSEAVSATAALAYINSKTEFGATPSDLTSDASSWSGSGVGTVQRIDVPIDPTVAGYATVWVHLATGSSSDVSIHFDPKLDVT